MTELRAGVARVHLTPPVGIPLIGFTGRPHSTGVHDELTGTALVLESGQVRVAIVGCDLLDLDARTTDEIRAFAERATGIPAANILIASSHTHYGPSTGAYGDEQSAKVGPYAANLVNTVAGAITMADARRVPARMSAGSAAVTIGINRRERTADGNVILGQNPDGPMDDTVRVLRIDDSAGKPLAAVLNYACHGVSLGPDCTEVTADFPGPARRTVEDETGALCLFLQGAAGDINPLLMEWDFTNPARLGLPLGAEAVRAFYSARPITGRLAVSTEHLELAPMLPASVAAAERAIEVIEREEPVPDSGITGEEIWRAERIERLRSAIEMLSGRAPIATVAAEITAIAFGESAGLVSAPAEIFTEIGRDITAGSHFQHTFYAGYTNGMIGYLPTRSAYAEGGYEVTHGCQVAPEAGELIAERSIALLAEVREP